MIAPNATITDTPQTSPKSTDNLKCPSCGAIGVKDIDFTKDTQSSARNPKLKCTHCGKSRVSSSFKYPS